MFHSIMSCLLAIERVYLGCFVLFFWFFVVVVVLLFFSEGEMRKIFPCDNFAILYIFNLRFQLISAVNYRELEI